MFVETGTRNMGNNIVCVKRLQGNNQEIKTKISKLKYSNTRNYN